MLRAIKEGYGRYFDFSGRTERRTFWFWVLFIFLATFLLNLIDQLVWGPNVADQVGGFDYAGQPLSFGFAVLSFIPIITMQVRRLHDIGRSGWWVLLHLIPILGSLVLLYFYVQPSEPAH